MQARVIPFAFDIEANEQLSYLVLTEVVRLIETESGMDLLLEMGFEPELIDSLRHRKARDLLELSSRVRALKVVLSPWELRLHLDGIEMERREDELCEYFVRNGASRSLIARLFRRTADDVRRLRELVGGISAGRSRLPKDYSTRDAIHRAWHEIKRDSGEVGSLREWIYALHQLFPDYTIDTLYSTLREFGDDEAVLKRRGSAICVGK